MIQQSHFKCFLTCLKIISKQFSYFLFMVLRLRTYFSQTTDYKNQFWNQTRSIGWIWSQPLAVALSQLVLLLSLAEPSISYFSREISLQRKLAEMIADIETTSFPLTRQQHVADANKALLNSLQFHFSNPRDVIHLRVYNPLLCSPL